MKNKLEKIIVKVPKQEDWNYVVGIIEKLTEKEFILKREFSGLEIACIRITNINDINCGSLTAYMKELYVKSVCEDHKIISIEEFKEIIEKQFKFKPGDKVKSLWPKTSGEIGEIVKFAKLNDNGKSVYQTKGFSDCKDDDLYCEKYLELVEEKETSLKEKLEKIIVKVTTQEDWDYVMCKLVELGIGSYYNHLYTYKEKTCIQCENACYSEKGFYETHHEYKDYKIISIEEFKEIINNNNKYIETIEKLNKHTDFKPGDKVRILGKSIPYHSWDDNFIGTITKVMNIAGDGSGKNNNNCIVVEDVSSCSYFAPRDLELVEEFNSNNNKTMTFQEQLYEYLEHNVFVPVKSKDGCYKIFCPFKDNNDNYKTSAWHNSLNDAKKHFGYVYGYCRKNINKIAERENWKILHDEIFKLTPKKLFKVSDEVRILNSIKEIDNWNIFKDDLKDMRGKINKVSNNTIGIKYCINDVWIGAEYIVPYIEEENDKTEEAIKLLKQNGYKIIKE